ncbi:MAG TPA: RNA polymerase sigma factor [Steroidobacteraceae bacterium]|jgi:RNA polymerase sigma-70 factor (ECF subfamily)|nr:RNA polymerase sigma factor [Steroidobacteraceae bacterium]
MAGTELIDSATDADDDASVVRRVLGGDPMAFALLMRRFNRRLYRVARAIMGDDTEAEDALQEAYLNAYRRLRQFRGDFSLATWLSRLVVNECLGRKRRSARRQNVIPMIPSPDDSEVEAVPSDEVGSPDAAADRAQMRAILERRIDALPEAFRAVFVLRALEELNVEETAQCLGIPAETVRSRHFRARSLLREALAREVDTAERSLWEFAGARCDRIVAQVLARLPGLSPP